MFSETILMERNAVQLIFQKEANGLLRGSLLVLLIVLFFLGYRFPWAKTFLFRLSVIFFAAAGFSFLGKKRRITFDKKAAKIHILNSFYLYKKESMIKISGQEQIEIDDVKGKTQILLRMTDGSLMEIAISKDRDAVQNWVHAVSDYLKK